MISVSQGNEYRKGELIIFTGTEEVPCPVCGGELFVHGTCIRKVRRQNGTEVYRLRVMGCKGCGRTHRELPAGMIPYKRMDADRISDISEISGKEELGMTEESTWHRVKEWVAWFLQYAMYVLEAIRTSLGGEIQTISSGSPRRRKLIYFVRLVANSGRWEQHRSVMTNGR